MQRSKVQVICLFSNLKKKKKETTSPECALGTADILDSTWDMKKKPEEEIKRKKARLKGFLDVQENNTEY